MGIETTENVLSKVKLGSLQKQLLIGVLIFLWISGTCWVALTFWNASQSHYRVPYVFMKIHAAFALVFLVMLGSLWGHVQRAWALGVNRLSGMMLIFVAGLLGITAWMLYYVVDDGIRNVVSLIHWVIGVLLPLILFGHIFRRR